MIEYIDKVIGLRTIKTAIAVFLSVVVANWIGLSYPLFVAMTAIFSMDKTPMRTLIVGRNRVVGTILGAVVGVAFATIDRGNPFMCFLGMLVLISLCKKLKVTESVVISGIVFMAIMVHIDGTTPIMYGMSRTFDSIVGLAIAFLVNLLIFPMYNVKRFPYMLNSLREDIVYAMEHDIVDLKSMNIKFARIGDEVKIFDYSKVIPLKKDYIISVVEDFEELEQAMNYIRVLHMLDKDNDSEIIAHHKSKIIEVTDTPFKTFNQY